MKFIKYFTLAILMIFSLNASVFCQVFSFEKNPNEHNMVFPAGSLFKGILQNDLDSLKNAPGDKVYLVIPADIKIGKATCIPKNSLITGEIIMIHNAIKGMNGYIQIKFEQIKYPDGTGSSLSAHIWSNEGKGIIGGEPTKRMSYRKMPHYIEDIGVVAQLIESGERAKGKEIHISPGSEFVIVLDNDLEVTYLGKF